MQIDFKVVYLVHLIRNAPGLISGNRIFKFRFFGEEYLEKVYLLSSFQKQNYIKIFLLIRKFYNIAFVYLLHINFYE
jgi:hypothetical protein